MNVVPTCTCTCAKRNEDLSLSRNFAKTTLVQDLNVTSNVMKLRH